MWSSPIDTAAMMLSRPVEPFLPGAYAVRVPLASLLRETCQFDLAVPTSTGVSVTTASKMPFATSLTRASARYSTALEALLIFLEKLPRVPMITSLRLFHRSFQLFSFETEVRFVHLLDMVDQI